MLLDSSLSFRISVHFTRYFCRTYIRKNIKIKIKPNKTKVMTINLIVLIREMLTSALGALETAMGWSFA